MRRIIFALALVLGLVAGVAGTASAAPAHHKRAAACQAVAWKFTMGNSHSQTIVRHKAEPCTAAAENRYNVGLTAYVRKHCGVGFQIDLYRNVAAVRATIRKGYLVRGHLFKYLARHNPKSSRFIYGHKCKVAPPAPPKGCVVALWKYDHGATVWGQHLITTRDVYCGQESSLGVFDSHLTGRCVGYQIDVYQKDSATTTLLDGKILTGPSQPSLESFDRSGYFATHNPWKQWSNSDCCQG